MQPPKIQSKFATFRVKFVQLEGVFECPLLAGNVLVLADFDRIYDDKLPVGLSTR